MSAITGAVAGVFLQVTCFFGLYTSRKGVARMTAYETIMIMLTFASILVAVIGLLIRK